MLLDYCGILGQFTLGLISRKLGRFSTSLHFWSVCTPRIRREVEKLEPRVLFDVTGLIQWYSYLRHPSGIQRFSERVLQSRPIASCSSAATIARGLGGQRFYRVPTEVFHDLRGSRRNDAISRMRSFFVDSIDFSNPKLLFNDLRLIDVPYTVLSAARQWRKSPQAMRIGKGDVVVCLADFWCQRGHVDSLLRIKRLTGAKLVQMVHDLFALDHVGWSHPYFGRFFKDRFEALAPHVDRWLTNSRFVAGQLEMVRHGSATPIDIVPMGWNEPVDDDPRVLAKHGLSSRSYFLHVGTLEPRKNLVSLIDAAERAANKAGAHWRPLVLVGRDGWRSGEIHKRLNQLEAGVVRWLPGVPDSDLPALYRGARFTIVASLGEGWGLPVQESLAQGVPCISSPLGGIPEVGGDLVHYVDPHDVEAIADAIADWNTNDDRVAAARATIHARLSRARLPTWDDAGAQVLRSAFSALS